MVDEPTADRLVRLGLTQYEARVYLALIRRAVSGPADVARLAQVPRPRVYDVLRSLVAKGLAVQRPGNAAGYAAVPPEPAMQHLVQDHQRRLEHLQRDARTVADELVPAFLAGSGHADPMDYIEIIRDRAAMAKRFDELQAGVERELISFSTEPAVVPLEQNRVGIELAGRHTMRSVYELSLLTEPGARAGIEEFIAAGEQARFAEKLPMKLVVIDERIVLFALNDPVAGADELTSVVVDHSRLAASLKIAFESVWASALTLPQACRRLGLPPAEPLPPPADPSRRDR
ncbi:MAG TPA: helix-turn-helix domain-containing protein [Jatrophihabitans sp.]|jgi:sugar-specific transcriptional regulator TrmB|nr:helix-turn-helix domain-containing protein [Jatrophihabitans sp.]